LSAIPQLASEKIYCEGRASKSVISTIQRVFTVMTICGDRVSYINACPLNPFPAREMYVRVVESIFVYKIETIPFFVIEGIKRYAQSLNCSRGGFK
jgi:hypothetical protein